MYLHTCATGLRAAVAHPTEMKLQRVPASLIGGTPIEARAAAALHDQMSRAGVAEGASMAALEKAASMAVVAGIALVAVDDPTAEEASASKSAEEVAGASRAAKGELMVEAAAVSKAAVARSAGGGGRFDERSGGGGGGSSRRPKGAPSRFGSIGREMQAALHEGEDVDGGVRVDEDGMVYELADGSVRYFQDEGRKYPFTAGPEALPLLRGLLATNVRVNQLSRERIEATGDVEATIRHGEALYVDKPTMKSSRGKGTWSDDEYAHPGLQAIYLRLKSLQRFTESWALYERAARCGVLDRYLTRPGGAGAGAGAAGGAATGVGAGAATGVGAGAATGVGAGAAAGVGAAGDGAAPPARLRVAALGGGAEDAVDILARERMNPQFGNAGSVDSALTRAKERMQSRLTNTLAAEPAAADLRRRDAAAGIAGVTASRNHFTSAEARAAPASARTMPQLPALHLVSLDLQPSWEPYVKALRGPSSSATYSFAQWDAHAGVAVLAASAHADAACDGLEVCLISNVLVHCTDEPTADVLAALLTTHGVHAILINERGVEQKMVEMLTQRGVVVVRLLSQSAGRDDRQLLVLPPGAAPLSPGLSEGGAPVPDGARDGCRAPTERSVFPNVLL
eukprot:jgi/Chrpa1/6613/Chrysochromulina_OHIO_Genome00003637-RA